MADKKPFYWWLLVCQVLGCRSPNSTLSLPDKAEGIIAKMLKKLFSEPLLHFIFLSLLIFVAYDLLNPPQDDTEVIIVSEGRVAQLANSFRDRWQREASPLELKGAIHGYAVNEMFIREARVLGLDVDDQLIGQRLRKKMNYLLQDLANANLPTDEVLKKFYADNTSKYRSAAQYSFQQVLLSADRGKQGLAEMVLIQQQRIQQGLTPQGDNSMLPSELTLISEDQIARRFGAAFAGTLDKLAPQQWAGPVSSSFGEHFVLITEKQNSGMKTFETVKDEVLSDWQYANNKTFQQDYEQRLLDRYAIVVQGPRVGPAHAKTATTSQ